MIAIRRPRSGYCCLTHSVWGKQSCEGALTLAQIHLTLTARSTRLEGLILRMLNALLNILRGHKILDNSTHIENF